MKQQQKFPKSLLVAAPASESNRAGIRGPVERTKRRFSSSSIHTSLFLHFLNVWSRRSRADAIAGQIARHTRDREIIHPAFPLSECLSHESRNVRTRAVPTNTNSNERRLFASIWFRRTRKITLPVIRDCRKRIKTAMKSRRKRTIVPVAVSRLPAGRSAKIAKSTGRDTTHNSHTFRARRK